MRLGPDEGQSDLRLTGSLRLQMRMDCGWGQNGSPGSKEGVTVTQVRGQGGLDGMVVMEW